MAEHDELLPSSSSRRESSGYFAILIGALVGAIVLALAGGYCAAWCYTARNHEADLGAVGAGLFGFAVGGWAGGAVGGFIALRIRRCRGAGTTFAVALVVELSVLVGLNELHSGAKPSWGLDTIMSASLVGGPLVAPLVARALVVGVRRR